MRILYALQGTGNGHLARALEVVPALMRHGDVDILVSGTHCEITLPWPVKYKFKGMGFIFGNNGGINIPATIKLFNPFRFFSELQQVPVAEYDLVINDFEPLTAWACILKRVDSVGLSHQRAVIGALAPRPLMPDLIGLLILFLYAPTRFAYGFHFKNYDSKTFTPIIRSDVRKAMSSSGNHYTVYLPAYSDFAIVDFLTQFPDDRFEVFSKQNKKAFSFKNVNVSPVNKDEFAHSMTHAKGVFCNAGFETPAETLYLKKKLCVIPMQGQYEQQCNAYALKMMGVPVIKSLKHKSAFRLFESWLQNESIVQVDYSNQTNQIVDMVINRHVKRPSLPQFAFPNGLKY